MAPVIDRFSYYDYNQSQGVRVSRLSEVEYRADRELWHLDMAIKATTDIEAQRHSELARRYADYTESVSAIESGGAK